MGVIAGVRLGYGCCFDDLPKSVPHAGSDGPRFDRTANYKLVDAFIRWYELQYISGMQRVGGMTTDVADIVAEVGVEETANRYAALRRIVLDYAMTHPTGDAIPEGDLDDIGQRQYEHVLVNVRSSSKWIKYKDEKLRQGVIDSYKGVAPVWVGFCRKLLAAPTPPEGTDFREHIRSVLSRADYATTVEQMSVGTDAFYAALKKGVTWYAPWAPLTKSMLDKSCAKDKALCQATIDQIYEKKGSGYFLREPRSPLVHASPTTRSEGTSATMPKK